MGRVYMTMGMGMATFSCVLKFPWVDSMRMQSNKMLDFWRDNRSILPKMFCLARRILCIPTSSAASERVFSAAGRLLEKHRTNLASDSVNSLLFLNSNM